jgi:hypothetical protein
VVITDTQALTVTEWKLVSTLFNTPGKAVGICRAAVVSLRSCIRIGHDAFSVVLTVFHVQPARNSLFKALPFEAPASDNSVQSVALALAFPKEKPESVGESHPLSSHTLQSLGSPLAWCGQSNETQSAFYLGFHSTDMEIDEISRIAVVR